MRTLKIQFVDFWYGFDPNNNFITNALNRDHKIVVTDTPDYLFFSVFGYSHLKYNCVKIMFVGENIVPDFNLCDYAMGFDYLTFGDRYMRLPLFLTCFNFKDLLQDKKWGAEKLLNRKFCSIVVSNINLSNSIRERFFRLLSEYKQVDSGGRQWNNVGGPVQDKQEFISNYKFNIAFENSAVRGYTTEKIMDAMTANTLPIYWGNPWIGKDFNERSFINVNAFSSLEEAVQRIVELDTNDEQYLNIMKEPWVEDLSIFNWENKLKVFLTNIIEKPLTEARYLVDDGIQKLHKQNMKTLAFANEKLKIPRLIAMYKLLKGKN